ncbi:hypothetical protein THRCLA_09027 [Thraustotheca clavata]|uniref:Protein kinase domain-containing protein n=1 Tax=Thraustotheca clavata TaxID=74557 RepID=A0A1V9Z023_9STRA|nr:hypothetical protein THRCLA_09027 [Thraustotheca clavata]
MDALKDVELTIPKVDTRPAIEKMFTIELGGKTLGSVATSLKDRHRRWMQKMLISFGSVTPSPDTFYTREKERFLGLLKSIQDIRDSLAHYKAILPQYSLACAQLGVDVWCVVSADAVGQNVAAEKFRHAMCAINEKQEIKSHFFNADAVLDGAVRFVEIHIRTMESYKFLMDEREVFKLDYDSYERALQRAQASKRTIQEIDKLQAKVTAARVKLDDTTTCLYQVFAKYESERNTMLNGELEMVRQVMHTFYLKSCQVTNFTIQSQVDGEAIAKKERELFENMRKYGLLLSEAPSPTKPSTEIIDTAMEIVFELSTFRHFIVNLKNLPPIKTVRECIGKNNYALVAQGDMNGTLVALKRSYTNVTSREHLVRETHLLSGFEHPSIIHCFGATWRGEAIDAARNDLCCVLEYMEDGDLENQLSSNISLGWFPTKLQWIYDIANAIAYLHQLDFVHHDIDPSNVLIRGNRAKLCQFGQCLHESEPLDDVYGNVAYMAPEIALENCNCPESDIWSFGALLSMMDRHMTPYLESDLEEISTMEMAQELAEEHIRPSFSDMCPPEILSLAHDCLKIDPSDRPSAENIIKTIERIADTYEVRLISDQRIYSNSPTPPISAILAKSSSASAFLTSFFKTAGASAIVGLIISLIVLIALVMLYILKRKKKTELATPELEEYQYQPPATFNEPRAPSVVNVQSSAPAAEYNPSYFASNQTLSITHQAPSSANDTGDSIARQSSGGVIASNNNTGSSGGGRQSSGGVPTNNFSTSDTDVVLDVSLLRHHKLELSNLVVISDKPLASGGFGEVWLGLYGNEKVSVKRTKDKSPNSVLKKSNLCHGFYTIVKMSLCPNKRELDITLENVSEFLAPTIDFGNHLIIQNDRSSSLSRNIPQKRVTELRMKRIRPRKSEFQELNVEYKTLKAKLTALQNTERHRSLPDSYWYQKANRQAKRTVKAVQENNRLIQTFEDQMRILRRLERKLKKIRQINSDPKSWRLRLQSLTTIDSNQDFEEQFKSHIISGAVTIQDLSDFLAPTLDFNSPVKKSPLDCLAESVTLEEPPRRSPLASKPYRNPREEYEYLLEQEKILSIRLEIMKAHALTRVRPTNEWYHLARKEMKAAVIAKQENARLKGEIDNQLRIIRKYDRAARRRKQKQTKQHFRTKMCFIKAMEPTSSLRMICSKLFRTAKEEYKYLVKMEKTLSAQYQTLKAECEKRVRPNNEWYMLCKKAKACCLIMAITSSYTMHNHNQHDGELYVKQRRHVPNEILKMSLPISTVMPMQHSTFFANLSYFAIGTTDQFGRPWATIVTGHKNSLPVYAKSNTKLDIASALPQDDPFAQSISAFAGPGELWAGLGVDFTNRRRNKVAGKITGANYSNGNLTMELITNENMGNCPKYITHRDLIYEERVPETIANTYLNYSDSPCVLSAEEIQIVHRASTIFFVSRNFNDDELVSDLGLNHRGGAPGFCRVTQDGASIILPDYSGNRFYQSLGNVQIDGYAGMVIPCFVTGDMLYVTGIAQNLYDDEADSIMPRTSLVTQLHIKAKVYIKNGLSLKLQGPESFSPYNPPVRYLSTEIEAHGKHVNPVRNLATLVQVKRETPQVLSFTFELTTAVSFSPGGFAMFDFSPYFNQTYRHMNNADPQSLNDDYIRTWTISSSPPFNNGIFQETKLITCTIKLVPSGAVTPLLHVYAKPGFQVPLVGVGETFSPFTRMPPPKKMLWLAAGIGVTPFLAFTQALKQTGSDSDVIMLLATRGEALHWSATLSDLKSLIVFDSSHTTSKSADESQIISRRMEPQDILNIPDRSERIAYICGPNEFMTQTTAWLENAGVSSINKESIVVADNYCDQNTICYVNQKCQVTNVAHNRTDVFKSISAIGNLTRYVHNTITFKDSLFIDTELMILPKSLSAMGFDKYAQAKLPPQYPIYLQELDVKSSPISKIPTLLPKSLQKLTIKDTKLDSVERFTAHLKYLALPNNNITHILNVDLPTITHINLDNNPISTIVNLTLPSSLVHFSCLNSSLLHWSMSDSTYKALRQMKVCQMQNLTSEYIGLCLDAPKHKFNYNTCTRDGGTIQPLTHTEIPFQVCVFSDFQRVTIESNAIAVHSCSTPLNMIILVSIFITILAMTFCASRTKSQPIDQRTNRSMSYDEAAYPILEIPVLKHYTSKRGLSFDEQETRSLRSSWGPSVNDQTIITKSIRMFRLELEDIRTVKLLSSGSLNEIWLGNYDGQSVAIKRIKNRSAPRVQQFIEEIQLISRMDSPYLVQFIGVSWELPIDMEVIVEYMNMGDLRTYFNTMSKRAFSWHSKLLSIKCIARGLVYLHTQNIVHQELKSRNILLDSRKGTKLSDFGKYCSTNIAPLSNRVNSFQWMAPEVIKGYKFSASADIYAFGIILSEFSTHCIPYNNLINPKTHRPYSAYTLMTRVTQNTIKPAFDVNDTPSWVIEMSEECLNPDPSKRPSAANAVAIINRLR